MHKKILYVLVYRALQEGDRDQSLVYMNPQNKKKHNIGNIKLWIQFEAGLKNFSKIKNLIDSIFSLREYLALKKFGSVT